MTQMAGYDNNGVESDYSSLSGTCKVLSMLKHKYNKLICFFNGFPDAEDPQDLIDKGLLSADTSKWRFQIDCTNKQESSKVVFYNDERQYNPQQVTTNIPDNLIVTGMKLKDYEIPIPTKKDDWMNTYEFDCWIYYEGDVEQRVQDINDFPITINMDLYAKFKSIPKTYIIYFHEWDFENQKPLTSYYTKIEKKYHETVYLTSIENQYNIRTHDNSNPDFTNIYRGWGYNTSETIFSPKESFNITQDFSENFSADVNGDITKRELHLYVQFATKHKYWVTVVNHDGTVLYNIKNKLYYENDVVTGLGKPTKDQIDRYTYEFDGWSIMNSDGTLSEPSNKIIISGSIYTLTYQAHYREIFNAYITFDFNDKGNTLPIIYERPEGTTFKVPNDPVMWMDDDYEYYFYGWRSSIGNNPILPKDQIPTKVTRQDITYTSQYQKVTRYYTVKYIQEGVVETLPHKLSYAEAINNKDQYIFKIIFDPRQDLCLLQRQRDVCLAGI